MQYQVIINKKIYIHNSEIEELNININGKYDHRSNTRLFISVKKLSKEDLDSLLISEFQEIEVIKYYLNGDKMVYHFKRAILNSYKEDYGSYINGDIKSELDFVQKWEKLEMYILPQKFDSFKNGLLTDIDKKIEEAKKSNKLIQKVESIEEFNEIEQIDNSLMGGRRKLKLIIVDFEQNKEIELNDVTTFSISYNKNKILISIIGILTERTPDIIKKLKVKNLNENINFGLKVSKFNTEIKEEKYKAIASTNSSAISIKRDEVNVIKYDEKYDKIKNINFFYMVLERPRKE